MSVGAICFTSSGSNGGCWVVLVFPRFFFCGKMSFFSPYTTYAKINKFTRLTPKKKFPSKKNATYAKKKSDATYAKKKIKKRLTLFSTIELRFPHPGMTVCSWLQQLQVNQCPPFADCIGNFPTAVCDHSMSGDG